MELSCATKLKEVGKLTEAQLSLVISTFSDVVKGYVSKLCDILISKSASHTKSQKPSNNKSFSKKQLAIEAVNKIEKFLAIYEANDYRDDWSVNFGVGINLTNLSLEEILIHHKQLVFAANNCDKIKLLISYEKGRVYGRLKELYSGEFVNFCKLQLNLDSKTVGRYIE